MGYNLIKGYMSLMKPNTGFNSDQPASIKNKITKKCIGINLKMCKNIISFLLLLSNTNFKEK